MAKNDERLAFLADRMAILLVDLVRRDFDYGPFCFDEFFENQMADEIRRSQHYHVAIDFVRKMVRRHNNA